VNPLTYSTSPVTGPGVGGDHGAASPSSCAVSGSTSAVHTLRRRQPRPNSPQRSLRTFDNPASVNRAIDHSIRDIEQRIFTEKQSKTIFELSEASRHLIDFKKITSVWPDALDTLMQKGAEHFGPEFAEQTAELIAHHDKLSQKAATLTEAAHELRETNATILSTKQNELMKVLTIFSVVIAVITGVVLIWLGYLAIKR